MKKDKIKGIKSVNKNVSNHKTLNLIMSSELLEEALKCFCNYSFLNLCIKNALIYKYIMHFLNACLLSMSNETFIVNKSSPKREVLSIKLSRFTNINVS